MLIVYKYCSNLFIYGFFLLSKKSLFHLNKDTFMFVFMFVDKNSKLLKMTENTMNTSNLFLNKCASYAKNTINRGELLRLELKSEFLYFLYSLRSLSLI